MQTVRHFSFKRILRNEAKCLKHFKIRLNRLIIYMILCTAVMEKPGLDFISLTQTPVMYGVMDPRLVNSVLLFTTNLIT